AREQAPLGPPVRSGRPLRSPAALPGGCAHAARCGEIRRQQLDAGQLRGGASPVPRLGGAALRSVDVWREGRGPHGGGLVQPSGARGTGVEARQPQIVCVAASTPIGRARLTITFDLHCDRPRRTAGPFHTRKRRSPMHINDIIPVHELAEAMANKLIRAQHHDELPLVILNYTYKAQINSVWNRATTNARGLIYNAVTGQVVARPFRQFCNYN